jgi:hypothetical protein
LQPSIEQNSIIDSTDEATKALKQKPLQVHHRDGVRFNNDYTNLEIVTRQVNTTYAHGIIVHAFVTETGTLFRSFNSKTEANNESHLNQDLDFRTSSSLSNISTTSSSMLPKISSRYLPK